MSLPFGKIWCCNRSLADITFEDCVIEGICKPMEITFPAEELLTLRMVGCTVTPRAGYEDIPLLAGESLPRTEGVEEAFRGFANR